MDLFRDFESRYFVRFGQPPEKEFLSTNYRSTKNIIEFVDQYATVQIIKRFELLKQAWDMVQMRRWVLDFRMFRDSIEELSLDLSKFLHNVFRGNGVKVQGFGK